MAKVVIEMTLEHGRATIAGLDLANRIALGQFDEIATLAGDGRIRKRDDRAPEGYVIPDRETVERVLDHAKAIAALLGHRHGSFGIGAAGMHDDAKRQYEVMKAIAKAVADHDNPGGNTVHHDGVMVRYAKGPAPTACIAE